MELPADAELRELVRRQAQLSDQLGKELGARPLVLPNSQYFPDRFEASRGGVTRLLHRMQEHAGMDDIPIDIQLNGDGSSAAGGSCSSGACAPAAPGQAPRLLLAGDDWTIALETAELRHPVGLTTTLARSLAAIFLEETRADGQAIADPPEVTQDLAGICLGFGPLLLEGSYIYQKSCGGPSVARLTALGTTQLAVGTALFAAQHGHSLRKALRVSSATQKAALSLARDWVNGNTHLAKALAQAPSSLTRGEFSLNPPARRWLSFGGPKKSADQELEEALLLEAPPIAAQQPKTSLRSPEDDELKALVESSLAELRG